MNNRIPLKGGKAKYIKYFVIIIVLLGIGIIIKNALTPSTESAKIASDKVQIKAAIATKELNKDIQIPVANEDSEDVALTMRIETLELRDEIIVQGQKATSVAGRSFLVVNLKLINPLEQGVEVNTKDYLRLEEDGKDEWLAPDIHNDPVLIQAISTKPTRLAFPIDAKARKFKLQIGEISGEKEVVEINF